MQLESIKVDHQKQQVFNSLSSFSNASNETICAFTSPEVLINPPWPKLIEKLTHHRTLSLVCADEVRLHANFAISFRKSFLSLKHTLFEKLKINDHLRVPIIFMTETFNNKLLCLLSEIIKYNFTNPNTFWSKVTDFSRKSMSTDVSMPSQRFLCDEEVSHCTFDK